MLSKSPSALDDFRACCPCFASPWNHTMVARSRSLVAPDAKENMPYFFEVPHLIAFSLALDVCSCAGRVVMAVTSPHLP